MTRSSYPPRFRETLDMLKEAIRHSESAISRAARLQRDQARPGYYSVVSPRGDRSPKGK